MKKSTLFLSLNLCLLGSLEVSASRTPQPSIIEDPDVTQKKYEIASHLELITAAVCAEDAEVALAFFQEEYKNIYLDIAFNQTPEVPYGHGLAIDTGYGCEFCASLPPACIYFSFIGSDGQERHEPLHNIQIRPEWEGLRSECHGTSSYEFSSASYLSLKGCFHLKKNFWELLHHFYLGARLETDSAGKRIFKVDMPLVSEDFCFGMKRFETKVTLSFGLDDLVDEIENNKKVMTSGVYFQDLRKYGISFSVKK